MASNNDKRNTKKRLDKLTNEIKNLPPEKIEKVENLLHILGKRLVSIKEAAEILDVSLDTIRRAIKQGSLKGIQLNNMGNWKIPMEEIERFIRGGK